uniref:Uncharacterized protein n=1 Tax=Anopheles atroparvus TaxID=41427 RepID=A0AAG5DDT2_ANOAO
MGCSQWKTVRFKVRSPLVRNVNNQVDRFLEGSNRPPTAEQLLLQRVGQLKLDQTGSDHDGRERPNGSTPSGWLETLFQSVIL